MRKLTWAIFLLITIIVITLAYYYQMIADILSLFTFEQLNALVSSTLTASGFLIGTASFLITIYLRDYKQAVPAKSLRPFVYLIVSLISFPTIFISIMLIVVLLSSQIVPIKFFYSVILSGLYIPISVMVYLLKKHWPSD